MSSGCVVSTAPAPNADAQVPPGAKIEWSATVQVHCARATTYRIDIETGAPAHSDVPPEGESESGNHADTIMVTVMY